MTELVRMIALASGTVTGSVGIVHVNPDSRRENGRYSHPEVPEDVAVKLEARKLAKRADGLDAQGKSADVAATFTGQGALADASSLVQGDATMAASGVVGLSGAKLEMPGSAEEKVTRLVPVIEPQAGPASDKLDTGLSDEDPDMPAAPVTPAPTGRPKRGS